MKTILQEKMDDNFSYRTITTSLRPQKVATLIDINDEDWIDTSMRIIEFYSQVWGGNYDLIIPTDGGKIDNIFLQILKAYDPDYIYIYSKSLLDLKYINNMEYEKILSPKTIDFKKIPGINEDKLTELKEQIASITDYKNFEVSQQLKKSLLEELNPLFERDNFINHHSICAEMKPGYPLTNIIEIFKSSKLEKIINYKINDSKILQLLGYSVIGSAQYIQIINKNNQRENSKIGNLFEINSKIFEEKIIERENINDFFDIIYENKYSQSYKEIEELSKYTPFEISMKNLSYLHLADQRKWEINDTVVLVVGDKVEDFCLYYNLLKLKKDAVWLPYNLIKQEGLLDDYLLKTYGAVLEKIHNMHSKKDIVFTSLTLEEKEIEDISNNYKEFIIGTDFNKAIISKDLNTLMPFQQYIYEKENYLNINTEPFLGNESINFINMPFPRSSNFDQQNINPLEFRWITDIRIGTKKNGKLDRGYILPPKRVFSNYLFDKSVYSPYTRVIKDGVSLCGPYFTPFAQGDSLINIVNMNRPKIKILNDYDIFKIMFEDIGYSINLSDKGKYLLESLNKVGSLEEFANIFLDINQFKLLQKFIYGKNKDIGETNYEIDERIYIDYETIKGVITENTEALIDDYIKKNILYRGLIFKCSKCSNTQWYSISEIDESFKCKRCSSIQIYLNENWKLKSSSSEPKWYYKLDEVFYQGLSNNMYVTLLTLNQLKNNCKKSFIFIPEIELFKEENGTKKQKKEIDVCCICDGEIIIGECKINERLGGTERQEKNILNSLDEIFKKLRANKCIFSTYSTNWRSKTLELIENKFNEDKLIYNYNNFYSK